MPLSLRLITSYHLSVARARDFPCTYNLHNYPHKKRAPQVTLNAAYIPRLSAPLRIAGHSIDLGGECFRAIYRNLTNSIFSVARSLTTTIHIFFRWQATIFPHTFSPQLFRWRYILNIFPCVKNNFSIHVFSTSFRVIYPSRFSTCVFCVLIFHSYCNSIFRMICALDFPCLCR